MKSALLLSGKRIHVAGSISPNTSSDLATYGHDLVQKVVRGVLDAGGGLVVGAGKEPKLGGGPALVFDWTVLEVIAQAIREGSSPGSVGKECPIVVVLSEKGETEIPDSRKSL